MSIFGLAGGPLLGTFTLGMFFPWANAFGAFCGLISSIVFMFWIGFGAMFLRMQGYLQYDRKAVSIEGCSAFGINATLATYSVESIYQSSTEPPMTPEPADILDIYKLSYMWYSGYGFIFAIIVGLIVSALRGFQDPKKLDPDLVIDVGETLFWYLPKRAREFLRFRVGDNHVSILYFMFSSSTSRLHFNNLNLKKEKMIQQQQQMNPLNRRSQPSDDES